MVRINKKTHPIPSSNLLCLSARNDVLHSIKRFYLFDLYPKSTFYDCHKVTYYISIVYKHYYRIPNK